jgi:threonine dehydratase
VDEIVTVSEQEIARSIVGLVGAEHLVVEGAGAVGVAALMAGRIAGERRHIAIIITGANIDRSRLTELLSRASATHTDL